MSNYWRKRFELLEQKSNEYGLEAFRQIEPAFIKAEKEIQKEIESWYGRYAKNNNVSMLEARRQLSTKELKEFRWDVDEYIKYGRENAIDPKWMKELENASARVHINRLEALKIRTQQAAEAAFGNELDVIDEMARKVYTEDYYHSIFEMHKGFGVGWNVGQVDERKLGQLISKPWAADGKNFSQRIWNYRDQLVNELHTQMTQACVLGKHPKQLIDSISKKFKTTKGQAGRLVMTEQAFFHSAAQKDAFKALDVEEFEVVATLDGSTSDICQDMDGQHFPMSEFEVGVTAPPFHCWCRSVTAPYFEDNYGGERAARDVDGKTYYVPDDMTYHKWKKSFVDGDASGLTVVDNIDDLNKQLADKQRAFSNFAKQLQQVKLDKRDWEVERKTNPAFAKFNSMSDDERAKYIKRISDEKDALKKEYDELAAISDKYYNAPDKSIDREKWREWREWRRTIDYDDLFNKMMNKQNRIIEIDRELFASPRFEAFKARFGDMTEQNFLDKINDLAIKQAEVQKEIDELVKKIKDATRISNGIVIKNEHLKILVDKLDDLKVEYNPIKKHKTLLTDDEIITALAGGDKTKGSCASVGLAYIGQKGGYNVLDFRGGESQEFFSQWFNLKEITKLPNTGVMFETAKSSITAGNKLLKKVEQGKEYYFVAGRHASIIRKTDEGVLQYLELQSQSRFGWQNFDGNPRSTLHTRFGCRNGRGWDEEVFMIDVEQFKDSEELQILLGYINTAIDKQKKGVGGTVK